MKTGRTNSFIIVAFLLFFTTITSISFAQDKQKSFTVNKGDKLDLSTRMGNITIGTWDKNEVNVVVKNIIEEELNQLKMEQSGSVVKVIFKGDDSDNIEFEVTIPSELNLDLATGGGNISLNGDLDGTIDVSTAGGNISTKNINGKADISTAGGNITTGDINNDADISTAGGDMKIGRVNGTADISTAGGNIKVGDVSGSADISTAGGNISVKNVGGNADVSTAGGNISVQIVSGSAEINTAGGNLSLSSATGKVEANTAGGNIKLEDIHGFIDANTAGGNIYAELYPDGKNPSDLNTAGGNIELLVPSDAKATIIATFRVKRWYDGEELDHIKSDFKESSIKRNKEDREVEVTYVLNGGGSTIELNTAMGDIEIRKLK
ncbi:MAG: hypothetical protein DRQ13_03945 [Ignavibacteriae bacterium]|nr:MAG: hypothetical protein DRQ13_03945 [Ignavibacteriota bacterium]